MTPEELQTIVTTVGLECRVKGQEVVVHVCYFCGNDHWNLELNAGKGIYGCWACRAGGRLDAFLTQVTGRPYHLDVDRRPRPDAVAAPASSTEFRTAAIADVPSAHHYLTRRGIDELVILHYGLRVCMEPGHLLEGRIVIPALDFWTGKLVGWVGRNYTHGRPKYISTLGRNAITGWRIRGHTQPVVLVEGHFDGIAVHRAGFHAAVLSGQGDAQEVQLLMARLAPEVPLVVMMDADAATRAAQLYWQAKALRELVSWVSMPPGTDPANLPLDHVQEMVNAARP